MTPLDIDRIRQVDDFDSLIVFLRDELEWPLEAEDIEDLSFDYKPEELGISDEVAVKINFIKQLRPLAENQPWGIFYIDFEPKKLPVVVLRRVLQKLVIKKRPTAKSSKIPGWQMNDLLFINAFGETEERNITFAHFKQEDENQLPTLKVIGWDGQDTPLHIDRCSDELGYLRFDPDIDADTWKSNWSQAFTTVHRHSITTSKKLAQQLAELARTIRINAEYILKYETEGGRFKKTMAKFKTALIHDLTEDDFADMYAQTIAYGLLYTAIRSHVSGEATVVSAERVKQLVLPTNPFLKEVMEGFFDIGARRWSPEAEQLTGIDFDELGINDIVATLKDERTDFDAILRDFGNKNPDEDPVIHFYELFLKEYDALKRKSRGVYYTPRPVVSFIVRSVDEILRRDFGLSLGLADTTTWGQIHKDNPDIEIPDGVSEDDFFVQILDPALGTGTFLVEAIDLIHNTMVQKWQTEGKSKSDIEKLWNKYVPDKLLPRLYGFELMMAPYAIAHMKIGIKLFETGYQNFQQDNQRVRVYLTNTLQEPIDVSEYLDTLDPAMAEETREANEIKNKNSITIVVGNPPYAMMSSNLTSYAKSLVEPFRYVDNKRIIEKSAIVLERTLQDDYVKFLGIANHIINKTKYGLIGMITNNSYLEAIGLRGLRYTLLKNYAKVNLIDLHGDSNKRETYKGAKDENVFDIQKGVAISILLKNKTNLNLIFKYDLPGTRKNKFRSLLQNDITTFKFKSLTPLPEKYEFIAFDVETSIEYSEYLSISEMFYNSATGIETGKDSFLIDFEKKTIKNRLLDYCDPNKNPEVIAEKYGLTKGCGATILKKRGIVFACKDIDLNINLFSFSPFDTRYIFYSKELLNVHSYFVAKEMFSGENISLIAMRQVALDKPFTHIFVSRFITNNRAFYSTRGKTYFFPIYISHAEEQGLYLNISPKENNLLPKIRMFFSKALNIEISPINILQFIYAIFHSNVYRERYDTELRKDFPHIPLTTNVSLFRKLCEYGSLLIGFHLMESDELNNHITTFPVSGDNAVTKVGEKGKGLADIKNGKGKLFINKTQYFDNLTEDVWNFHIGGYQVCHKWLADRKKAGRKLSAEDIEHYHKIVVAIDETIKIMNQIDEVIESHGGWPIK